MSLQEQNHALKELYMYYICLYNTNNQLGQFMRFYYYSQPSSQRQLQVFVPK